MAFCEGSCWCFKDKPMESHTHVVFLCFFTLELPVSGICSTPCLLVARDATATLHVEHNPRPQALRRARMFKGSSDLQIQKEAESWCYDLLRHPVSSCFFFCVRANPRPERCMPRVKPGRQHLQQNVFASCGGRSFRKRVELPST